MLRSSSGSSSACSLPFRCLSAAFPPPFPLPFLCLSSALFSPFLCLSLPSRCRFSALSLRFHGADCTVFSAFGHFSLPKRRRDRRHDQTCKPEKVSDCSPCSKYGLSSNVMAPFTSGCGQSKGCIFSPKYATRGPFQKQCAAAFGVKTLPLPCASTASVAKTVPLPCVPTAFVATTPPLPCGPAGHPCPD